jgi:selenocysteine-specific elongation factor
MKHLIIGTAGHVDHGKTALIRALTGIECDTHKEEKERGITINLGFAHLELSDSVSCGIVDVPGHKDFIRTMVAGVHGIDLALLVIAADSGIMPQTREHFNIISMLGIKHLLVVINKCDLVDNEMLDMAKLEAMEFLEDSPFEKAAVVAVSALTGLGIEGLKSRIAEMAAIVPQRAGKAGFRMYIDRIFNLRGIGIVVTGSVLEGSTKVGDELNILPGNQPKVKVRSIERHGSQVQQIEAGDRAALHISGIKFSGFERGMLLTDSHIPETQMIDAQIELFEGNHHIGIWSHQLFHTGTFSAQARVHLLNRDLLKGGEKAVAQIHLDRPALLLPKDRFILRNTSSDITFGGGMVIDAQPLHHRRRTGKLKASVETLSWLMEQSENLKERLLFEVQKSNVPLTMMDLSQKLDVGEKQLEQAVAALDSGMIRFVHNQHTFLFSNDYTNKLSKALMQHLSEWHTQNPLSEKGLGAPELAGKLHFSPKSMEAGLLQVLLDEALAKGLLKMVDNTYALVSHQVKMDKKVLARLQWLEQTILQMGTGRTAINELEAVANREQIRKGELFFLLDHLAANGRIVKNKEDVVHIDFANSSRQKLLAKLAACPNGINEKEFRLLINGTKRLVQLMVDFLVAEGSIEKKTFYLHITPKGRNMIAGKA